MILTTTKRTASPAGTVLHVAGEVDTLAADGLRDHLRLLAAEQSGAVVVQCSDVTFMSCTALAVLAQAKAQLGPRLLLGGRSRVVTRLLDMTGLTTFFPCLTQNGAGPAPDGSACPANGAVPRSANRARTWTFSRTDVERVRGLLMAIHGCDAEQAWSMLALAAARHGIPVGELVELLIRARRDSDPPPSSAAAIAALTVLTRKPLEDAANEGDPVGPHAATGSAPPAESMTNT